MKIFLGIILIIHGLITASQSSKNFGPTQTVGLENPSWLSWWPTNLGRSWFLSWLGLEKVPFTWVGGLFWLLGGVALIMAGLGIFGVIVPTAWWHNLAVVGAAISLFMLLVYLHPLFILGIGMGILILILVL